MRATARPGARSAVPVINLRVAGAMGPTDVLTASPGEEVSKDTPGLGTRYPSVGHLDPGFAVRTAAEGATSFGRLPGNRCIADRDARDHQDAERR